MRIRDLPLVLTRSRFVLGPAIFLAVVFRGTPTLIVSLLVVGLLTDIFDGVIARRLKVVTSELRSDDSRADGVYSFSILVAIVLTHFSDIVPYWPVLLGLSIGEAVTSIIDKRRYGKPCAHHTYSAKLWVLSFCVFAISILAFHKTAPFLAICIALGYFNNVEGYVIRGLLPLWAHDVSGIPAAVRLRRVQMASLDLTSE